MKMTKKLGNYEEAKIRADLGKAYRVIKFDQHFYRAAGGLTACMGVIRKFFCLFYFNLFIYLIIYLWGGIIPSGQFTESAVFCKRNLHGSSQFPTMG